METVCSLTHRFEIELHGTKSQKTSLINYINLFARNSKNKNIRDLYRGITEFERGFQARSNLMKDEPDNLLAYFHTILNRWKNYFTRLLNVHNVSDVRQIEIHTSELLVPGPSLLEAEIAIAKLKKYVTR
jgi:hypothetical protein